MERTQGKKRMRLAPKQLEALVYCNANLQVVSTRDRRTRAGSKIVLHEWVEDIPTDVEIERVTTPEGYDPQGEWAGDASSVFERLMDLITPSNFELDLTMDEEEVQPRAPTSALEAAGPSNADEVGLEDWA